MTESDEPRGRGEDPQPAEGAGVGSVGEEAAKLLGALSEWARDSGDGPGPGAGLGQGLAGLAGHAAATAAEINAHLDTGAAECSYCPICRTVHVLRAASPEVKAHLTTATSSLLQAVAAMMATPPGGAGASRPGANEYERIDLDEDDDANGSNT